MTEMKDDKFLLVLKDIIKSLAISLVIVFIVTQFIVRPVIVEGLSMYPTLNDQEVGFSNIFSLKTSSIKRFDIVVAHHDTTDKNIVKRVIGLPNDTVEYREDVLYINNERVEEPFLDTDYVQDWKAENDQDFTTDFGPVHVPEGQYFLMGDNRQKSADSRRYSTFDASTIKSKSVYVFLPINKLRAVTH